MSYTHNTLTDIIVTLTKINDEENLNIIHKTLIKHHAEGIMKLGVENMLKEKIPITKSTKILWLLEILKKCGIVYTLNYYLDVRAHHH